MPEWEISPEAVDSPIAAAFWREYYTEVSDRWYLVREGRRTDPEELESVLAVDNDDGLRVPGGLLLVARHHGKAVGQAGVRLIDAQTAELKRLYIRKEARGCGCGRLLVGAAEDAARHLGAQRIVLDTRSDLVEAVTLYERLGYQPIEPYSFGPYVDRWFAKLLSLGP
jgi:GNAT superfamily N-acetyltransferase